MLNLTKCLKYLKLKCQAEDTNLFLFQRRHRTIAHGTTCQICQYTTFTERETVLHTNKKHAQNNENGESICSLCSKTFQSVKSLTTHIRIDHFNYQPFSCPHCDLKFDKKTKMNSHMQGVHSEEYFKGEKKYLCDKCDKKFYTAGKLICHKTFNHTTKFHVCEHCGKSHKTNTLLRKHMIYHHEKHGLFICDTCGKEFTNPIQFKTHTKNHTVPDIPGAFPCPIKDCGKAFGKAKSLKDHMKTHEEKKPPRFQCQYCPKKFREKKARDQHEKGQHLGIKDFKCDLCDYANADQTKLIIHKKSIHEGILYHCDYPNCTKSYNLKGNLYAHRFRVHKISRPMAKTPK
jgi:hypothetical protein